MHLAWAKIPLLVLMILLPSISTITTYSLLPIHVGQSSFTARENEDALSHGFDQLYPGVFEQETYIERTIFYDDFEDDPIGSLPDGWSVAWSGAEYGVTDRKAASGKKSLYLKGSYGWSCVLYRRFSSNATVIGFEADIWLGNPETLDCPNYGCPELPISFFCKECVNKWGIIGPL